MLSPSDVDAWSAEDLGVLAVFGLVYLGMFLGRLPGLRLDRAGVALLGAIAVMAITGASIEQAARAVDGPTIALLFAFMVLSAQMQLAGFYGAVVRAVGARALGPAALLAALMSVAAALSAVFSNDVVCLAMAPLVARIAGQRGLDPVALLVGLACAANIGSALTLIGNPQNMLIGSVMQLPFAGYVGQAALPVAGSLVLLWAWLLWGPAGQARCAGRPHVAEPQPPEEVPVFDRGQSLKGGVVAVVLMGVFLFTEAPREAAALLGAAVLLLSRRLPSAQLVRRVDGPLLILFIGLFVVNHAFEATGLAAEAVKWLAAHGVTLADPGVLLVAGLALSNLVSNVPAVMLLLPHLEGPAAGTTLALVSTFAGNLLLVGSIANLIVADLARRDGIVIDWRRHAVIGVPVTLGSVALLAGWMQLTTA